LGGGAPTVAVFVLLDDVGHVNDTSHVTEYGMFARSTQTLPAKYRIPMRGSRQLIAT
jgi:hypothetical protein